MITTGTTPEHSAIARAARPQPCRAAMPAVTSAPLDAIDTTSGIRWPASARGAAASVNVSPSSGVSARCGARSDHDAGEPTDRRAVAEASSIAGARRAARRPGLAKPMVHRRVASVRGWMDPRWSAAGDHVPDHVGEGAAGADGMPRCRRARPTERPVEALARAPASSRRSASRGAAVAGRTAAPNP